MFGKVRKSLVMFEILERFGKVWIDLGMVGEVWVMFVEFGNVWETSEQFINVLLGLLDKVG